MKMSFFPNAAYQALRCVIATTLICAVSLPTNHRALGDDGSDIATEVESDDETNSLERNLLIRGRVTDENGNPVVGATIRTITRSKEMDLQTTSRGGGAFALKVHAPGHYGPSLMVTDPSGELASFVSRYQSMTRDRKMFNVVVKPWQTTTVTVVDENELPVVGATVVLQADFQELARKQTDAAGKANLQFPADARVDWINALKDDVGYDYYENYDAFPTQERLNVPQSIKLTLRGAVSVIVTVIDDLNNPVEGASISPWTIKVPNKISYANVGGTLRYQTNEDGQVEIPWIPKDLVGACTMLVHHQHYHCPKTPPYYAGQETELTANVFRNAIVTGQVTFADGSPAANIRLQGEGRGNTNHYFRGHTSTGSDGRYEIKVYPNQDTIIAVTDDNYAARTAMGINLAPAGKHNADFVLTSGTLIHGVLTVGKDKEPLTGENATLIQKEGGSSLVRWSNADPEGYYSFRVGPGVYTLRLPGKKDPINVTVEDEKEIVHDSHIPRRPRGTLNGTIVNAAGEPVVDAEIRGETIGAFGHAGFKTASDDAGEFTTERWTDKMLVYAVSTRERLAGYTTIDPDTKEVDLTLKPAAMIHGSAIDKEGKPVVGNQVQLTFAPMGGGSVHFWSKTDADGKFAFPAATGTACTVYLHIGNELSDAVKTTVERTKRYELKPIQIEREGD